MKKLFVQGDRPHGAIFSEVAAVRGERVHAAPPARESFLAGDEPRCEEESWALLAAGRLGFVAAGCRRLLPAAVEEW